MTDKLTTKQELFIKHYFECGYNSAEACNRAGYKGDRNALASMGFENLKKPAIKRAIQEKRDKIFSDLDVGLHWKVTQLRKIVERCMEVQEKYDEKTGDIQFQFDPKPANTAIAELNKMAGDHAATNNNHVLAGDIDNPIEHILTVEFVRPDNEDDD